MAYQIDRYNNTPLAIVEDGTVDQTTDLKFIGKNYAGYGEAQNENFLFLLENFSGTNAPARPLSGQIWFDTSSSKLKFYDGTNWRTTGGAEVTISEPDGQTNGDLWWDISNEQLYVYNGTSYVLVGPQNAGLGETLMKSIQVYDTGSVLRTVITSVLEDEVISIISANEFTLDAERNDIAGFDVIKQGITLKNTKESTLGVTTPADHWFWGTASNAAKFGGLSPSSFLQVGEGGSVDFSNGITIPDSGLTVGDGLDLLIYVENGDDAVIENQSGINSTINFYTTNTSGTSTNSVTINSLGLVPGADNTYDIGTSSLKWANVHAYNFLGEATKATTLRVGSDFRSASVAVASNTVAVRDGSGNLSATLFQGTATAARYADLAEKYTTAQIYPVGTAVCVCDHPDHEMEAYIEGSTVLGVVSDKPAFLMNSEADGQAIALVGRVPVRIVGPVTKGQRVYAWENGVCTAQYVTDSLVGMALESNVADDEKLVECILKLV